MFLPRNPVGPIKDFHLDPVVAGLQKRRVLTRIDLQVANRIHPMLEHRTQIAGLRDGQIGRILQ